MTSALVLKIVEDKHSISSGPWSSPIPICAYTFPGNPGSASGVHHSTSFDKEEGNQQEEGKGERPHTGGGLPGNCCGPAGPPKAEEGGAPDEEKHGEGEEGGVSKFNP